MNIPHFVLLATTRHRRAALGFLVIAIFLAVIVWLIVLWSRAKSRADRAEAELSSLRSEHDRRSAAMTLPSQASSPWPPSVPGPPPSAQGPPPSAPGPPPFPS